MASRNPRIHVVRGQENCWTRTSSGWCSIDTIVPRDDRTKNLTMGVKLIWKYKRMADTLAKHAKEIDANLQGYRFADNMELITDLLWKA